jgi:colanic acid biosynthesis protein WcaH
MNDPGWIREPLYSKIKLLMPIPCVDLLITFKGKILLMKRKNKPGRGLWFTPGGRIYLNESLKDAVKRVLNEETGLEPYSINQIGTMSHVWPELQTITTFYKVLASSNEIILNNEHDDYRWIDKIEKDLHPYVVQMISKSEILEEK